MSSVSSATSDIFQDLFMEFYSRRLLLHTPLQNPDSVSSPSSSSTSSNGGSRDNSFDTNVVMVLSVLLCALICSLGLNSIVRCALRCSTFVSSDSSSSSDQLSTTGIQRKALKTFTVIQYSDDRKPPGLDSDCAICLSEFISGERIRLLPKCNHGFHVKCIDKWLSSHSSCPKCRHCLVVTCRKIVGCANSTSSEPTVLPQETIVTISPLHPEAFIRDYR